MARKAVPKIKGLRVYTPPPKGFDALAATKRDLAGTDYRSVLILERSLH
jgi:hypothetical protein